MIYSFWDQIDMCIDKTMLGLWSRVYDTKPSTLYLRCFGITQALNTIDVNPKIHN